MVTHHDIIAVLEPVIDPIREGIIICDSSGNVLLANPAVRRLFGLGTEDTNILLSNLGGHNLRKTLIDAGLEQSHDDQHICAGQLSFEQRFQIGTESR